MPSLEPPPDHLRDAFREYLIRHGGTEGISGLGHAEEIKRFKFYLQTFEVFISRQESQEKASLEAKAAELSEEVRGEFWSWYYPVHWDEIFRTTLRSSFLISLVSRVELQLTEVCRDVAVVARTPITVNDLKGGLLERARLFLEKFGGFQEPSAEVWARFSQINDIRNVFVHHGGFLPSYNHEKRVRQFVQISGSMTETNGFLTLEQEFCPRAVEVARQVMNAVATEFTALCGRAQRFEGSSE